MIYISIYFVNNIIDNVFNITSNKICEPIKFYVYD